jgi:chromosome segregation ATPase
MDFSFGNILSIAIVLVILIIYRQIDRNNRSLEKVKRFSDKIKDELASAVEDKTAEMKNLAIELQVNMKAGKEVLKRVREVEDGLQERAQGIDEIRKKITGYDHALEELVGMTARVDENLKRIHNESLFVDKVGKRITGASQRVQKIEQDIGRLEEKFRQENQKGIQALRNEISRDTQQRVRGIAQTVAATESKVKDFSVYVTRLEARGEEMQSEVLDSLQKSFERLELDAKAKHAGLLNQFVASLNKLLGEADARGKALKKNYGEALVSFEKRLVQAVKKGEALEGKVFENLKALINRNGEQIEGQLEKLHKQVDGVAAFRQQLDNQVGSLMKESERVKEESLQSLAKTAEQMQTTALQSVEEKLEGYARDIEYKFQKLETANLDIEAMEKNLQELVQKTSSKVRDEFAQFSDAFTEERNSERERIQGEFAELQAGVKELEEGLSELKSNAYENVSSRLQVFEEDFFKDLRDRNVNLEGKIQEWQSDIEGRIQEVADGQLSERQSLEKRFSEELKNELERTRQESFQELRQLQAKVADFESSLLERVGGSEEYLEGFRNSLTTKLEQTRKQAQGLLDKQLRELHDSVDATAQRLSHEVEERLRSMESSVNGKKSELEDTIDTVKGEIASWQARVAQALKEYELEFTEKYTVLRQESDSQISKIREAFAQQSEDLIAATNEERLQLKEELTTIGQRADALEDKLNETSDSSLESFKRQVEAFQAELNQRSKDIQVEMDNRVRSLKQRLSDMKDKTENQQQSLFGKIDEGYQLLSISLGDMEKRVKSFTGQTKIFERADELKVQMETRIEEMKRDLEKLQGMHKEVDDLESRVTGMKKTVEEVGSKLVKLLSERGRVEDMDSEFKKLLNISKELDHRLGTVYSSQDTLQEIQAKIRELENLEKLTEGRFERLEKKKAIIEATTEGVDRSFQQLDELEGDLKGVRKELEEISKHFEGLKVQFEQISSGREKSEYVVQKIQDLDSILEDLEARMEKLGTAREWLAKTETRFEHIGKQAQDQVRLMESILKADKKQSKLGEGAPPMDKRETVVKLAHLGWSPVEIARTTKLSRGEVELILELAPNK